MEYFAPPPTGSRTLEFLNSGLEAHYKLSSLRRSGRKTAEQS